LPDIDAVPKEVFLKNRKNLLKEIATAKIFFSKMSE